MGKFRFGFRLLATLTLLAGLANVGLAADPSIADLLGYKPSQRIEVTTPNADEIKGCTKELETGKPLPGGKAPTAWVVKDAHGKVLRKFHDTTGGGGVNVISFYRDGEEVYREIYSNGKLSQFRWVGQDGSRWGVDTTGGGKVDTWTVISPEEVAHEVLSAVLTKDEKRFDALLMTKDELAALGLPAAEAQKLQTKLAGAGAAFQKTVKDLGGLKPTTQLIHTETKVPQTTPADSIGAAQDIVAYKHAALLYQDGNGQGAKTDWIQLGDLIQVGKAWRLIQGPTAGMNPQPEATGVADGPGIGIKIPDDAAKFIKELEDHDKNPPAPGKDGIIAFNVKRAQILEKIAACYKKPEEKESRDVWVRQIADCYASAAQQGDKGALDRLGAWKKALGDAKETGATMGYVEFRLMSAEYAVELPKASSGGQEKLNKLQETWKEKLTRFVTSYPSTGDTPDAYMQLGMVNEYFGAKTEADAKNAYGLLVKNFPTHPLAKRAQGCLDRLSLEGSVLDLTSPTLAGGPAFTMASLKGKVAIVYYWASWNDLAATDFGKIKLALKEFAGKVELVTVNLDANAADASAFLRANPMEGTHLYQPGGLESPLAVRYGITALPVMFVVGPDGKVVNRTAQASTVDEELKKLLKGEEKKDK
jgi:hypothetical protein